MLLMGNQGCVLWIFHVLSILSFTLLAEVLVIQTSSVERVFDTSNCSLSAELKNEITSYQDIVNRIVNEIMRGKTKGKIYKDLAKFADKFGPRWTGSDALRKSLDYLSWQMEEIGFSNIHAEPVVVPKWQKGSESLHLIEPWQKSMYVMPYAYSIGTPPAGIKAEIVVMFLESEIMTDPDKFKGKIVATNFHVQILVIEELVQLGALAILTSAQLFSVYGIFRRSVDSYAYHLNEIPKMPTAQITPQDADLLISIYKKGKDRLVGHLTMTEPSKVTWAHSKNVIGELTGTSKPKEIFLIAGHVDTWDVGQGSQDDGIGVFLVLETINLFKKLQLRTARTIRAAFWTGEEIGKLGSKQYNATHFDEFKNYQGAMESDSGCLEKTSFLFHGSYKLGCIAYEISKLISPNLGEHITFGFRTDWSSDMTYFVNASVPTFGLGRDPNYFWYHHSNADTMLAAKPINFDRCFAIFAAATYVSADIKENLPRGVPVRGGKPLVL